MNDIQHAINSNERKFNISVFDLLVILYFLHKLLPSVGYYMPAIVYFGVFALLAVCALSRVGSMRKINVLASMSVMFLVSVLEIVRYVVSGSAAAVPLYLYGELQVLLFGLAVLAYHTAGREHKKKYLFYLVVACYILTSVTTILGNIKYPQASRLLATTDNVHGALYTSQNIGSFTFVYELVLITPLFIYMFKNKRINRLLALGLVALFGYTVIKTEYVTALLLFVLTVVLFFIPKPTNKKIFVMLAAFAILFLVSKDYLAGLFGRIAQGLESETVAIRFQEIAAFLGGRGATEAGNVGNRTELYRASLDTFFRSYGLGSWGGGIGGHSFVLDTLGQYGIFGLFAMAVMYRTVYALFIKPFRSKDFYPYLVYVYIVAIVLAVMNPKTYLFVFMVVFPLFAKAMEQKNRAQGE